MCNMSFLLHCVHLKNSLSHLVNDLELGGVSVSLINSATPLCVHPLPYLFLDTEVVLLLPFILADAPSRSDMLVRLLSCMFLLQSDHSIALCRDTAGNLNDNVHSSILAVFRSRF